MPSIQRALELETIATVSPSARAASRYSWTPGRSSSDASSSSSRARRVSFTPSRSIVAAEQRLELVELVEAVERADAAAPKRSSTSFTPCVEKRLLPRAELDRLGVDERAVEVEEERLDHCTIVE